MGKHKKGNVMDIFTAISKKKIDYSHVIIFILTKKKLKKLMELRAKSAELMEALQHEVVDYISYCFRGFREKTRETIASAMLKIGLGEKICEEL